MQIKFFEQFKHFGKVFLYLFLVLCAVLLIMFGIGSIYSLSLDDLMGDPPSIYGYNQFVGFLTFAGVIILATGIGAVILSILIDPGKTGKKEIAALIVMALVSLYFISDDLFLFHERIFTGLFQVGERRIFLFYLIAFAVVFWFFRKQFLSGPSIFLFFAILFFGLSLSADFLSDKIALSDALAEGVNLVEEISKLAGYLFWTATLFLKSRIIAKT